MWKRTRRRDMADVNVYTAGRLSEMARSLGLLARSCTDSLEEENGLTREDALAAMQMAGLWCAGAAAGAICTGTVKKRTAIISIICFGPLNRRDGLRMRTCPGCFWKPAVRRMII